MARNERGMLDMRKMPTCLDHHHTRIGQPLAPQCSICGRHDFVVVAPDDQRRQSDAVQPFFEIGIESARLPAELRHREAVAQHHVHLRLARHQCQDALGMGLVVVEVAYRLFRPPDEIVAARHAFDADAGGCGLW